MSGRVNTGGLVHFLLGIFSSRATGQLIGLIAVLTIVWFAGSIVGLDTTNKKLFAMGAVAGAFIFYLLVRWLWTKRSGDRLAKELANHSASSGAELEEIQTKMQEALSSLKASHLGAGYRGSAALYALPWYMVIGPSAAGKSTLFANSGLHFPYANADDMHIQGFGGTRNCDWWFSDQAVLIDTAGRYTTEASDNKEWMSFLSLLKKYRPKLPINGVMVAISVSDILTSDSDAIRQHVKRIRERIEELITELGVIFPVYIVFTKTDLISGFEPFFADLTSAERDQVWGTYLLEDSEDQVQDPAELFELRMKDLYQRLSEQCLSKVSRERNLHRKSLILDFPNQFKSASYKLTEFVNLMFKQNPYQEVPWFAGVYFTSGTQEGSPIERMVSGVREQFCSVSLPQKQETITQSYFINKVFNDVMFKLQDLTRGNRRKRKVQRWLKALSVTATLASIAGATALLTTSFASNQLLFQQGEERAQLVVEASLNRAPLERIDPILGLFEHFNTLKTYEDELPWYFIFSIYEGDKTLDSIKAILVNEVEKLIQYTVAKPVGLKLTQISEQWQLASDLEMKNKLRKEYYQALKLQLMFSSHPNKMDKEFALQQINQYFANVLNLDEADETVGPYLVKLNQLTEFYVQGLGNDIEQTGVFAYWPQNDEYVDIARTSLQTQPEAIPLYRQMTTSKQARQKPLYITKMMSVKYKKLLRANKSVPYIYTKKGWQEYVYPEIKRIVSLASSGDWVMGTGISNEDGENLVDQEQALALEQSIRSLYFKDYAQHWFSFLETVHVKSFSGLAEASVALSRLSSKEGPIAQLLRTVDENIALSDQPKSSESALTDAAKKYVPAAGLTKRIPELDSRFTDLRRFTHNAEEGELADFLSQYITALSTIHSDLKQMAGSNEPEAQAMEFAQGLLTGEDKDNGLQASWIIVQSQLRSLEPVTKKSLENLLRSPLISSFKSIMHVARRQLDSEWSNQVFGLYESGVKGKYPFSSKGADAAIDDVSELLNRRNGVLWSFVDEQLQPFMKKYKGKWRERTWNNMGIGFAPSVLTGLDRANRVARSLFPKDGENSEFQFQMLPIAQRGVREAFLGFSEQGYRYRNEPEEWRRFVWPGSGTTERAHVYGIDSTGARYSLEKSGPWALLRILNSAKIKWIRGNEYSAQWLIKSQSPAKSEPISVRFNLKSGRYSGIFNRGTMTSFSLPARLFTSEKTELAVVTSAYRKG